ncbi:MAG: GDSL-type esterase/lipase family protein [Desulfoprunum sp.]|nr:GDSL-type esterase/lipase family protein [Desulfoprunum sp.]
MKGTARPFLRLQCVPLYFIQLFILLALAPLRPEGLVIHLSGYSSNTAEIVPVIQGKEDNAKALTLAIKTVKGDQRLYLNLLYFKDKPRDYVVRFDKGHGKFDITGVEVYTTFFSNQLAVIEVPGNAVGNFFIALNEKRNAVEQDDVLHNIPIDPQIPSVLLLRLSDDFVRYTVLRALVWRALLWSLLSTLILGNIVLVPLASKLALQHANRVNRSAWSALAYYYWSTIIVCLSLCIFVLLAEYATRFYFRDALSTSSGENYFYNKSYKLFANERNSYKYRGKEFELKKGRKFRIVVIGDSITFGQGVYPYPLRYTDLVEQRMDAAFPGQSFEVINLGACGHDLPEHIRSLPFVEGLHPDFILYQWFINDMDFMGQVKDVIAPELLSNHYWHSKLQKNSALYYFVQRGWRQLYLSYGKIKGFDQHIRGLFVDENSLSTNKSNERLAQLLDGIKDIGVPSGIVLFPHAAYPIQGYPFAFMHERIMKICENRNIPCLDLRGAYSSFDDHLEKLWANKLDPHPSALAHDIAAKGIIDFFGSRWQEQATRMNHLESEKAGD